MDNVYKATIAALQGQVVSKGVDYSQLMVAELQSGWGLNYRQEQTNFIADQWFPMIGVDKIAGLFPKWGKANAFTPRAGTWRPGTTPAQGELKVDDPGVYACQRYAFEMPLDQDIPYVADPAYSIERMTTQMVSDVMQLNKELIIANSFFKSSVWSVDITGASSGETWEPGEVTTGETFRQFNDSDSDPLGLFKDCKLAIKKACGVKPNTLIMGEQVYEELRINSQLMSLFRNPQASEKVPEKLNEQMLARALDVEKIIVAGAMYNTAAPDKTVELDWIFGKHMWLGYVDTPGPMKLISGLNLAFNEPLGGFDTAMVEVQDQHVHTTWYQGFQCWTPKIVANDAGMMLLSAVA
jgi:hypothetical protein